MPNGIPSHDTFRRVFSLLDPAQFAEAFRNWTESLRRTIAREIVRDTTRKRGIKGKQKNAAWDHSYLLSLLEN